MKMLLKSLGAASVIGVLATLAVPAEALDLRAKVPFSFSVNQRTLSPGTYTVSTTGAGTVMLNGFGGGAISLTIALQDSKQEGAKLVFHRYGEQYVLREVWSGGNGRKLPEPKIERELIARNGVASFAIVVVPIG